MTGSAEVNFDNLKFVFAKTMPAIPHWWCRRSPANERDYVALFRAIQKFGRDEKWHGPLYRYWYAGDGYKYWAMTTDIHQSIIINRAMAEAEDRAPELPLGR